MNTNQPNQPKRSLKEILEERMAQKLSAPSTNSAPIEERAKPAFQPPAAQTPVSQPPITQSALGIGSGKLALREILELKRRQAALAAEVAEESKIKESASIAVPATELSPLPIEEDNEEEDDEGEEETGSKQFALNITLNEKQQAVKELMLLGKSCVVTGAAGTGKTTVQRAGAEALLQSSRLTSSRFKLQGTKDYVSAPSIAFVAYTRRAASNLRKAIHSLPHLREALAHNIMTIHALLEYQPVTYWDDDAQKEVFRFEPQRTAKNPLDITHLVVEESSMLGLDLWEKLYDALPDNVQIVFIGDINQLAPVFGPSILNYALTDLPVIELTEVYRQAQDSPILANAHRILKGQTPIVSTEEAILEGKGSFRIVTGNKPIQYGQEKTASMLGKLFDKWHDEGFYNEETDIILSPWNKRPLGTDNLNNHIAQFLGKKQEVMVHEIIASFHKHYLAIGDKVIVNKMDGVITDIRRNGDYVGMPAQPAGTDLTRFGLRILPESKEASENGEIESLDSILEGYENFSLAQLEEQEMEKKAQASHVVAVELETGETIELRAAGDFNPAVFSLGYALTVHKAQGSEWDKVFLVLHKDHRISLSRELLYTAVTRARKDLIIISKMDVVEGAIRTQRIKGDSLADKIAFFNSGFQRDASIRVTKP